MNMVGKLGNFDDGLLGRCVRTLQIIQVQPLKIADDDIAWQVVFGNFGGCLQVVNGL
ncbi:MAG: hypothetical protein Q4B88_00555 [Moraxella sp.]|nr:hypothetical protein [Moraxella sp.]